MQKKNPQMCAITFVEIILFFLILMLCPICRVLMSDILIHLKGCAKTVPLHTTLPANPRYWLGADSKATPVGLCAARSKVIDRESYERKIDHEPQMPLIPIHTCSWSCDLLLFSITVAQFCFTALTLVYSSGHSPSVDFSSIWILE